MCNISMNLKNSFTDYNYLLIIALLAVIVTFDATDDAKEQNKKQFPYLFNKY